jgi:hypothetical protein
VFTQAGGTWLQQGVKLTGGGEIGAGGFGYSVALSADGNTALVGGHRDNSFIGAGWVFTRSGGTWKQEGSKLTGGGEDGAGSFGVDVTLSADGNTALVGGPDDDDGVGAVWVFARSGGTWSQQGAKLTGSGESGSGGFGGGVAVSSDGNTALVGGPFDNASSEVGAAWVFTRSGGVWSQQGSKLTGAGVPAGGWFGWSAALSGDGNTALIGSYPDSSFAGATWVFTRSGGTWSPQSAPVGGGASGGSYFGYGVALSSDGNTAVVGGPADNGNRGATWVFSRSGATWTQQGSKLTGSDASGTAYVGVSVSVSAAGNTVLAGGPGDSGNAGAAWVFAAAGGPVPAAPTGVAAVPGVGKASVSFTPPAGPVSGYTVIAVPSGATATGTSSPIVVTGLTNGTTYTFRVVAANAGGMGPASAASNEVIPGFPTRPTAVTAVADDARATVRWTAPASDGGSAITGYVVTPYIGAVAQTPIPVGPLTGTTVTGLTNDTTYTFTVTAVNAVGAGAASAASNAVTPNVQGREPPEPPAPSLRPTVPDPPAGGMRPPLPGAG